MAAIPDLILIKFSPHFINKFKIYYFKNGTISNSKIITNNVYSNHKKATLTLGVKGVYLPLVADTGCVSATCGRYTPFTLKESSTTIIFTVYGEHGWLAEPSADHVFSAARVVAGVRQAGLVNYQVTLVSNDVINLCLVYHLPVLHPEHLEHTRTQVCQPHTTRCRDYIYREIICGSVLLWYGIISGL